MIVALVLAAALQADVYTDDAGCRWKKRPPAAVKAASGAKKAKPGPKRPAKAKPKTEDDEFIGCDEEGFGVWKSDIEDLDFMATDTFVPLEMIEAPDDMPAVLAAEPVPCDCDEQIVVRGFDGGDFGGGGGGGGVVTPHVPAVPEPETWLMMLVGVLAVATRLRR